MTEHNTSHFCKRPFRLKALILLEAEMTTTQFSVKFSFFFSRGCRMSGVMPDTVQMNGNELKVLKVDEAVNTTFVCEVKNRIGTSRDQVTAIVRGESTGHKKAHNTKKVIKYS